MKRCLIASSDNTTLRPKNARITAGEPFYKGPGCLAHIQIKSYTLYPEFSISATDKVSISAWKLRTLKQEKLQELYKALSSEKELTRVKKFFVSLPTEAAHTRDTL